MTTQVIILGLAQANGPQKANTATILILAGALIACVIALTIVVMLVRARTLAKDRDLARPAGALDELRALLRSGQITQQEFDAAKTKIAARLKGQGGDGGRITPAGPKPGSKAPLRGSNDPNSDSGKSRQ